MDIEDIGKDDHHVTMDRFRPNPKPVGIRKRKNKIEAKNDKASGDTQAENSENQTVETQYHHSYIPEVSKNSAIYVKTWGCTHNSSDSEYMAGLLKQAGYNVIIDETRKLEADCWLLNSCTVKGPSEQHFINSINEGLNIGKSCILAGCVPQSSGQAFLNKFNRSAGDSAAISLIGVEQIDRIVEVANATLQGSSVSFLAKPKLKKDRPMLDMPKIRRNALIEIISINSGCLNACTYCKTKHARGDLKSYPVDEIVARAKQSFNQDDVRELWITSEDTGAYGRDIGTDLPTLLHAITKIIPEGCMMRVGMTNPPYIIEHIKEICKVLQHPRVYSFMHIPVQSGSDSVLYSMKREYTNSDFCYLVDELRKGVDNVSVATDIIAGYPSETDEDWVDSMELIKKYDFPSLFMNQFFPRPGTVAARMEQLDRKIVKKRTKEMAEYFKTYTTYDKHIGEIQEVLITEKAHDKKSLVGHNKFYHQVLISETCQEKFGDLMGHRVMVKITECLKHSLHCEVLRDITPERWLKNDSGIDGSALPMGETTNHELMGNENLLTENVEDDDCGEENGGGCCSSSKPVEKENSGGCCQSNNKPEETDEKPTPCCQSLPKSEPKTEKLSPILQEDESNNTGKTILITGAILLGVMIYQKFNKS